MRNYRNYENYEEGLKVRLSDPVYAKEYLSIAIEEYEADRNIEAFLLALQDVVNANGGLSSQIKLSHEELHAISSEKAKLETLQFKAFKAMSAILHGLGFKFSMRSRCRRLAQLVAIGRRSKPPIVSLTMTKVSAEKVLDPHFQQTVERMRGHERVFAIQDTTYLDYTDHPATQGLGPIGKRSQKYQGLVKHTTLVVSASGLPLGCLTDKVWVRDASEKQDYKTKPLEAKESYKWIEALLQTQTRTPEGVEVITVCDREVSDIYEFFVEAKEHPFVIRAAQNRRSEDTYGTPQAFGRQAPLAGEFTLDVPARPEHPARQAHLQVRFAQTTLCLPHRCQQRPETKNLPPVPIYVVSVIESNPPDDITPLNWLLPRKLSRLVVTMPDGERIQRELIKETYVAVIEKLGEQFGMEKLAALGIERSSTPIIATSPNPDPEFRQTELGSYYILNCSAYAYLGYNFAKLRQVFCPNSTGVKSPKAK